MNVLAKIPSKEEYQDIRNRLNNRPYRGDYQQRFLDIEQRMKALEIEFEKKNEETNGLRLALSDAHARLLSQARIICEHIYEEEPQQAKFKKVDDIIHEVLLDYPGITIDDIKGVRRSRKFIEPRHRCYYEVYRQRPDMSFPQMGMAFHRDHSTLCYAVGKFKDRENA